MTNVPQRRRELAAPRDEKPEGAESHIADPHGADTIRDQSEEQGIRNHVPVRRLSDKPEPESSVGLDCLFEQALNLAPLGVFLGVCLYPFDTLPALDPRSEERRVGKECRTWAAA